MLCLQVLTGVGFLTPETTTTTSQPRQPAARNAASAMRRISSSSSPSLLLRYRSHEERTEDEIRRTPDVNKVVGSSCVVLHRRRRRHSKTEIFLVREINEDFDEWKNVLRTYLIKIVEFPQFAPDEERRQIRRTINDMRVQLLDSVRWNLSNWPYDKLMIVYESQGWVRKYFADYSCSIC